MMGDRHPRGDSRLGHEQAFRGAAIRRGDWQAVVPGSRITLDRDRDDRIQVASHSKALVGRPPISGPVARQGIEHLGAHRSFNKIQPLSERTRQPIG